MKKFMLAVSYGIGVIAGALLLWYIVFPFIGTIFQSGWNFVTGLF